jgi:hypothetical protein
LRGALGGPGTDIALARFRNLEYYNAQPEGELAPPEIDDRSDFVATDVADTIEWMLPQLMRIFVSSDDAVEFEARSPESEQLAKLITAYINYLFYTRNDGVGVLYDWFKDALIQKVGFVKVWAEQEADDAQQAYEGQTQEQLVMLMQDGWQLSEEPKVDDQGGLSFTVKKEGKRICIKVAACAPHEVRVDSNARWGDEPAMIAHVYHKRRFELEEEGYDLSGIGSSGGDSRYDSETLEMLGETPDNLLSEPHASHELYQCAEVYIKLDADGDGIAEWLCCHMIQDELMEYEKTDGHPFVWICPIPRPHAFFGDCPADLAIQPQKLRTSVVRAIEDNLMMTVNNRLYVNTEANVNLDDILENRPNGIIRGRGAANGAIQPLVQPNLGAPAYEFNEWLESWRENRTGFTRYSQGTDANALNKTATGVSIITQKSDQRMELIARFFAVGVKQLFAKMLKLAIQHQNKAEMVKLGGQWLPVNPSEWRDQYDVKIKVGLGTGSKEQQAARIMGLIQAMQLGVPMGVVGPQQFAEALRLYVEANEFKNPERFVLPEPSGMPPNPQAYQQEKQMAQQQLATLQQQLQQTSQENIQLKASQAMKQAELEQRAQESDQKHQQAMTKLQIDATKVAQDGQAKAHEHVMQAMGSDHQAEQDDQQGEDAKIAQLTAQVQHLTQVVQAIVQAIGPGEQQEAQ